MRLFQKPYQTNTATPTEEEQTESFGNVIFWGVLLLVTIFSVPLWFITVDESGKGAIKEITLTIIVLDLMCAWLVATMIKKWFSQRNLAIGISLFLIVGACVLWFTNFKVWAIVTIFVVCVTDITLLIKVLSEGFLSHFANDDQDHPGRGL